MIISNSKETLVSWFMYKFFQRFISDLIAGSMLSWYSTRIGLTVFTGIVIYIVVVRRCIFSIIIYYDLHGRGY